MALYRRPTNKRKSANSFKRQSRRTKAANLVGGPQRGGWRF